MKNREVKLILLCLSFICYLGTNQAFAQSSRFSFNKYTNGKGDTLNYRLLYPDYDTLRKYPLVVFLHGAGERGKDNEAQLKWGVMNFATDQAMALHPSFVVAPQCPEYDSWGHFRNNDEVGDVELMNSPSVPLELVIQLINKLLKDYPIDKSRIYITGLSMGGFGTFEAIERYPRLFAAAVPVCGGGDTSKVSSIKDIPIWIFNGAEDSAVNPAYSLNMLIALTKAGAHPGFTQYPETGHFSWLAAYSDPLMIEWIFRQHR